MSKTVLLVEDHLDSRELLAEALEFSGYSVIVAEDGVEAENQARSHLPDLILLDISLPLRSGWEVMDALRQDENTQHIPVIALTAHALPEDEENAREKGCKGYIPKPVKPRQVIDQVNAILG